MRKDFVEEIKYSFIQSIPVMLGYIFLGIAFGLLLNDAGYNFVWAFFISLFVYAGSMQFLMVSLITGGAGLIYAATITLFVNGRHIFYGLPFISKFKNMGRRYPYMVFSLTDETFSVLCNLKTPEGMSENNVMFDISVLNQFYWVFGSVLGGILGDMITFDTTGIDFSMTALFVVIVINQWLESKEHRPALIGGIVSIICVYVIGADNFLLPTLAIVALILIGAFL